MTPQQLLGNAVSALYQRFSDDSLHQNDIVRSQSPTAHNTRHWMSDAYVTKTIHQPDAAVFSNFRYDMGTILDIGAHWGYTALSIRLFGSNCPIVSIEASDVNIECLDEFRTLDGNYDFVLTPLGDTETEIKLFCPTVNGEPITGLNNVNGHAFNQSHKDYIVSLIGSAIPVADAYTFQLIEIPLKTQRLDDVLRHTRCKVAVTPIAAIKLDVEGFEAYVLRGAQETIDGHFPFIMIEGANRDFAVCEILTSRGYLYADRVDNAVRLTNDRSCAINGYWVHPSKIDSYRERGILLL